MYLYMVSGHLIMCQRLVLTMKQVLMEISKKVFFILFFVCLVGSFTEDQTQEFAHAKQSIHH